jgi:hypothetical protein
MSFKLFIYYCTLCGGWAAFVAWALAELLHLRQLEPALLKDTVIALLLGTLLALAIGTVDAILNSTGFQRLLRPLVSMGVGLVGGLLGGAIGGILHAIFQAVLRAVAPGSLYDPRFGGWMIVGAAIGASIGAFDLLGSMTGSQDSSTALRKIRNGLLGGVLGGFLGGVLFDVLMFMNASQTMVTLSESSLAIGLVILGMCIGLLIGLAQVILKEAWVRIESGRRAGRELILSKNETTVGRAESCDIGIFGDNGIEKLHARIIQNKNRYLLADANTPGGTYLNEQRITSPQPLKSGDAIRVGGSVLRFSERAKRK